MNGSGLFAANDTGNDLKLLLNSSVSANIVLKFRRIKSRNWNSDFLNSNYHASLGPLWQLTLLSNKQKWERKDCVFDAKKPQGLNLNANPGLSFPVKLSHWLKVGMWVLIGYLKPSLRQHLLGRCRIQRNGWFAAGLRATGKICQWSCQFSSVHRPNQVYQLELGSSQLQLPCKVVSSLTINFIVKQT